MELTKIEAWLKEKGEPHFRAKQIREAFYKKFAPGFDAITALPAPLRGELARRFRPLSLAPEQVLVSAAGDAVKASFRLRDGEVVESVLLNLAAEKWTVCVSTQVGCGVRCPFCATGRKGLKRNLSPEEITDQVLFWGQYLAKEGPGRRVGGVVFMGMGEPFMNYNAVSEALRKLSDPDYFGIGQRHISVSTAGHAQGILRFAREFPQVNLAVSLHTVDDEVRDKLVPMNKLYPLRKLAKAMEEYLRTTRRQIFIEYALMEGLNAEEKNARQLYEWIKTVAPLKYFTINLIAYNETGGKYRAPAREKVKAFAAFLEMLGASVTIRKSLGNDIRGACGQLASANLKGKK